MKYRVRIDASFEIADQATATGLRNAVMALQAKMVRVNALETSSILAEECHHDENPPKPCVQLYKWEKP